MGYRLYCYNTNPNNEKGIYSCYYKFYGYVPYKYVQKSWEYIAPIILKQDPEAFGPYNMEDDGMDVCYEIFHVGGCTDVYKLTSEEFKTFISLYKEDRKNWIAETDPEWLDKINYEDDEINDFADHNDHVYIDWG